MIGEVISHYRILEKLGGGGMSVVYKAEDTRLKRPVAIKFLPADLVRDAEAEARFINEAQAASALDHPNICTIHEIDEAEEGQLFIVMAYYEGQTLKKRIETVCDSSPLSMQSIMAIANELALGLAKGHEKGIVHRDIKPANVLLTNDGGVKIVDFGLAKLAGQSRLTKAGLAVGTVAYMSPEQARGEEVDPRTDIWSFGVVLYEMITGQLPFKGEYEQAIVYCILHEDPKPITDLRTSVPMEIEHIVNKAMAKNPDERYQCMDDMLVDLRQATKQAETNGVRAGPRKLKSYFRERTIQYGTWTILLLLLAIAGVFLWQKARERTSVQSDFRSKIRLAVLPFDNLTKSPEDEYFADGMTDEMIAKLSNIAGFGVIARTSVMQYKTNPKSIAEVGRELRVSKVLEGSVRKSADKLRIRVQLIDVKTEERAWGHDYDRQLADVFAIQSEVAQQVASALRVGLSPVEMHEIEKRGTKDLEAYTFYLQGNYYAEKRTPQGLNKGIEYFNEAIKLDPEFADAYAGLAKSYNLTVIYAYLPPDKIFPKAKAAAMRALEISRMLGDVHSELARIMYWYDWDLSGAERSFKRAIELSPGYARTYQGYAELLSHIGRYDDALDQIRQAQELDPLDLISQLNEGEIFYYARRFDRAIEKLNQTVEMDSSFFIPYLWLGLSYLEKGMLEEAIAATQKCVGKSEGFTPAVAAQAFIFAKSGRRSEAQKILDQLREVSQQRYVPPSLIALIYIGLDEKERAFDWFQKAYEIRDPYLVYHIAAPYYDGIRADQRFSALLKKMGLAK